jgi:hypothetical protein
MTKERATVAKKWLLDRGVFITLGGPQAHSSSGRHNEEGVGASRLAGTGPFGTGPRHAPRHAGTGGAGCWDPRSQKRDPHGKLHGMPHGTPGQAGQAGAPFGLLAGSELVREL